MSCGTGASDPGPDSRGQSYSGRVRRFVAREERGKGKRLAWAVMGCESVLIPSVPVILWGRLRWNRYRHGPLGVVQAIGTRAPGG